MDRITDKHLKVLCDRINRAHGVALEPYTRTDDGKLRGNIGSHYISSGAYGGVNLERIVNEAGGITNPLSCGHLPNRDLYNRMQAYLCGLDDAKSST